ncbi:glycosyltransferase family 2 protein [Sediminibacter sp. Hel_I_10]|uniref:glycosyltransferase family 2 protein n=1 Tax=Sediminibacter sp. Hel_I_10 TaxID=1392490 RepID=UPI00047958F1|nr:glycosyltransferase family 2 protein [Sediminibacter sp. Hel_I_10]
MTSKIAIVILNWNGKALLEQFLPSVIERSEGATLYVADNASSDDSVSFVKTHFPQVKIIVNSENGGYAKGYNDALKQVDADVFCLLNSDVEVTANWLEPINATFENSSEAAIIQPKILDYKNKSQFEYAGAAGGFIDKYGYPFCRGRVFDTVEKDVQQYDDVADIFWASGACFFIKSSVFQELGGFDEDYFAHFEEIDLCWRAFNKGFKSKYVGASTIYHVGGATLNTLSPKKTYLNFRNSLFTLMKNAGGLILPIIFTRLTLDGIAGLKFLLKFQPNHFVAILKAHFSFYWHLPKLLKQRRLSTKRKDYYATPSVVWAYFMKEQKIFRDLPKC